MDWHLRGPFSSFTYRLHTENVSQVSLLQYCRCPLERNKAEEGPFHQIHLYDTFLDEGENRGVHRCHLKIVMRLLMLLLVVPKLRRIQFCLFFLRKHGRSSSQVKKNDAVLKIKYQEDVAEHRNTNDEVIVNGQ